MDHEIISGIGYGSDAYIISLLLSLITPCFARRKRMGNRVEGNDFSGGISGSDISTHD